LRDVIAADALDELRRLVGSQTPDLPLSSVKLLPPIPNPEKILCVGINYKSHAAEYGLEASASPNIFLRLTSTLTSHEGRLVKPRVSEAFDFEGELALVVGRGGRHIQAANALGHIVGYTCFCDGTARDFAKHSLAVGKNFPATGLLGPWITTADEIADPARLTLVTRLNGKEMQRSCTDRMIHAIPDIVAFCSMFTPLSPGDVIATGTPEGVGAKRVPPVWMTAGDTLEVEISEVGLLRATVVEEDGSCE
jgi:2-keto-4-pentenoate hydratase/2-oxohepta-3-ene-1,7-dioic acid hydratase in catechol pathway